MPNAMIDAHRDAFNFFRENAGYVVGENAKGALILARAEERAQVAGLIFVWREDDDADWSWLDDRQRAEEHEVYWCRVIRIVHCDRGYAHEETLASLSGIFDPDTNYRRVVEAELALEALDRLATEAR